MDDDEHRKTNIKILRKWWQERHERHSQRIAGMFGVGDIDGYYAPPKKAETDDDYTCKTCATPVLMASLPEYRSLDTKQQGIDRLCTECWNKAKKAAMGIPGNDSRKP